MRRDPDVDPIHDIQVLSPFKTKPGGVDDLNRALQLEFNKTGRNQTEFKEGLNFKKGDKVMNTLNERCKEVYNPQSRTKEYRSIFNGMIGKVLDRTDIGMSKVEDDDDDGRPVLVVFNGETFLMSSSNLQHAYATTTHKAQGSEYKYCITVIPSDSFFVNCNMMYTAVT